MKRRQLLASLAASPWLLAGAKSAFAAAPGKPTHRSLQEIQHGWREFVAKNADIASSTAPLVKTEAEWKMTLPEQQFHVLRKEGTEHAFSSPLNDEHRRGLFVCAGCALPHFTSEMKFDSGTGWPSFFTSIPGHLATKQDYLAIVPRTEYHCVRCGGHQGHVFDDGPPPTGQRWCNNGVAQRFIPASRKA
ncbi:MAG TPA: peptide-methionine (R)-S-oxide reductase MsrB [Casimicrobiaceae bacterium]|nr:peptide-methionine (R)-S-oxide reductase MsrB [Casimicrobiaceae bacterium]